MPAASRRTARASSATINRPNPSAAANNAGEGGSPRRVRAFRPNDRAALTSSSAREEEGKARLPGYPPVEIAVRKYSRSPLRRKCPSRDSNQRRPKLASTRSTPARLLTETAAR